MPNFGEETYYVVQWQHKNLWLLLLLNVWPRC